MADGAREPQELHQLWTRFYQTRDLEGLVSLYEPDAIAITPDGARIAGKAAIAELYRHVMSEGLALDDVEPLPAITNGDLAITAMRLGDGGMTCEVARRQDDGTWLWAIDVPGFVPAA